jgi:salicylate hydroxylase
VHRADLQRALAGAVSREPDIDLEFGSSVAGFAAVGDSISIGLTHGVTARRDAADMLIGADGIHSKIRESLDLRAADRSHFGGHVAYRATINAADIELGSTRNSIVLRLGPRAHLIQYPLRGGSIVNLVAVIERSSRADRAASLWDGATETTILDRAFAKWSPETRRLLKAPAEWRSWPLHNRLPIASFSFGRVALVGDAAHPMVPFLAQGAAQAIEDAGALGRIFSQTQDICAGLAAYSRRRVARATRVQSESLNLALVYHLSGPLAFARDVTMRILGPRRISARYDWLFGA